MRCGFRRPSRLLRGAHVKIGVTGGAGTPLRRILRRPVSRGSIYAKGALMPTSRRSIFYAPALAAIKAVAHLWRRNKANVAHLNDGAAPNPAVRANIARWIWRLRARQLRLHVDKALIGFRFGPRLFSVKARLFLLKLPDKLTACLLVMFRRRHNTSPSA